MGALVFFNTQYDNPQFQDAAGDTTPVVPPVTIPVASTPTTMATGIKILIGLVVVAVAYLLWKKFK
jgi:hypothetical protein